MITVIDSDQSKTWILVTVNILSIQATRDLSTHPWGDVFWTENSTQVRSKIFVDVKGSRIRKADPLWWGGWSVVSQIKNGKRSHYWECMYCAPVEDGWYGVPECPECDVHPAVCVRQNDKSWIHFSGNLILRNDLNNNHSLWLTKCRRKSWHSLPNCYSRNAKKSTRKCVHENVFASELVHSDSPAKLRKSQIEATTFW